eukprot:1293280-Amphidinium_carterae.1
MVGEPAGTGAAVHIVLGELLSCATNVEGSCPNSTVWWSMLECDRIHRNGVPLHDCHDDGSSKTWEEYLERSLDLYYGRAGDDNRQKATAIHLLRTLTHDSLLAIYQDGKPTDRGVQLLLTTLAVTVQKEAPLRAFEVFDRAFYHKFAMRVSSEPMHGYIQHRNRGFERLKLLSPQSTLSEEIQSQLLLRVSGLSVQQRTAIISSTGNSFQLAEVERALRTQCGEIHTQRLPFYLLLVPMDIRRTVREASMANARLGFVLEEDEYQWPQEEEAFQTQTTEALEDEDTWEALEQMKRLQQPW